jgi:hypothetical protein
MKQRTKLSQQQHAEAHQTQQPAGQEFASAEELLRHDAAQTSVPPKIAERLKRTTAAAAPPKTGWLKRIFGGGNL